jgi:hypothetical protein
VIFAAMFALIAMGVSFYVITFGAMYGALGSGKLNPAMSPGVTWTLRDVGVPVSLAIGFAVFAFTLWRSRTSQR